MIYNIVDKNIFLTLLIILNNEIGKYRELKDPERKKNRRYGWRNN